MIIDTAAMILGTKVGLSFASAILLAFGTAFWKPRGLYFCFLILSLVWLPMLMWSEATHQPLTGMETNITILSFLIGPLSAGMFVLPKMLK